MVEGPVCKIKGEKIKAKVINQIVKTVSGNAVDRVRVRERDFTIIE